MNEHQSTDLAGQDFWDDAWKDRQLPPAVDPIRPELDFHVDRKFHEFFHSTFTPGSGGNLMEVGCAGSRWLPYFAKEYGFAVEGLDYSPEGCAQAKAMLHRDHLDGTIHQGDLFHPHPDLLERFDVVVSFGLVEHFENTAGVMKALARLLKPGGCMVTMVPNVSYIPGLLMRLINREVYEAHVPLKPADLKHAATAAGLDTTFNDYFLTINLSALSLAVVKREQAWWSSPVLRGFSAVSKLAWLANRAGLPEMPNRAISPFIMHVSQKS